MERHPLAEARGESVQAPTTNLPSNDPWRDEESPQTPETPRLVLECEKPSSAQGNAGKHREKDSRSRWREQPDATTKTADRKSTRLNSSHDQISYAVFCLKKKKDRDSYL